MSWFQLIKRRVLTSSSQNPALRTLFTPIVNGSRIIHFNWSNKPHIEVSKNTTKEMNGSRMFFEAFAGVKLSSRSFHYRLKSSSAMPDVILSEKDRITEHNKEVDFSRPEIIYEKKRTAELLRGLLILQLSSFDAFVQNSMKLMTLGQSFLGQRLFNWLMRRTFFGQFAIEQCQEEILTEKQRLEECGIASIFAMTAEEDVGEDSDHFNEDRYDRNLESMLLCLEMTDRMCQMVTRPKLTQLKVSSYVKADVLAKVSEVLGQLNGDFMIPGNAVSLENFVQGLHGKMQNIPELSEAEMKHIRRAMLRLNAIAQKASDKNIHILVDAEKVNINPSLSLIAMAMMKKFNVRKAVTWNTYQCYLKDTETCLLRHAQLADKEGICFGVKLVRGAYMDGEKINAERDGLPVPIHDSYEATNIMYDAMVEFLMHRCVVRPNMLETRFIIATHNEESILKAICLMKELGVSSACDKVTFGQLYGMCDHVSYALGQSGYPVYKSIVVGPVEDVLVYLLRRAQENNTVFHRLQKEKNLLKQEILRRMS
ncbi:putative proline dehydrogenase 2 [Apostichopus japonicus]|uniref:Proline dehydrogenase n=1 Tax=Stichopus japonicus TaxID=307972 RepID=A0A2G8JXW7_STIJA|nr:putative proline dehydrogenase 2 [Apostichopus japonicus]